MRLSRLFKVSFCILGFHFCMPATSQATGTASLDKLPDMAHTSLARYADLELDELFRAVAEDVHYEPYTGILRGAAGTALSRAGNDVDQALLLATLLQARGYRVRFVTGTLSEQNVQTLIMGLYPPELPLLEWPAGIKTYWPKQDNALQSIAAGHTWLELDQGDGTWLPLDPSFPRAVIGEAYAEAERRFASPPDSLHHQVRITLKVQTADGKLTEVGSVERNTQDLVLQPLGLTTVGIPQVRSAEQVDSKPTVSGLFGGGLTGDTGNSTEAKPGETQPLLPVATQYRRQMRIGGETLDWPATLIMQDKEKDALQREWLEITLLSPDGKPRKIARDLFVVDAPGVTGGKPADYRHYEIAVLPGLLQLEEVSDYLNRVTRHLDIQAMGQQLKAFDSTAEGAFTRLSHMDASLAAISGSLATLAFAAESDRLTTNLAHANGVAVAYTRPRVIIFSVEGQQGPQGDPMAFRSSLDLRLDEVDAYPYPGHSMRAIELFQQARGMQNSIAEANFIERIVGKGQSASTMNLMERVPDKVDDLLGLGPDQQAELDGLPQLSPYAKRLIRQRMSEGRQVIIPNQPVVLAGRSRYGWWEVDPQSGRMIGVMDDGLHQAMVDYSLNVEHLGLNDETGRAIGVIIGATSTQFLLISGILEQGTVTAGLLKQVEKTISDLKCLSCPEFSAKVGVKAQVGDSCFSTSKAAGRATSGIGFCQKYADGFGCAASLILHGLRKEMKIPQKDLVTVTPSAEVKAICLNAKVE
ncbi:transglutaminase domain-containing protein [Bowmanella dokdonensis]|uniref:Transglutaminase-like domain-containing protein n=1 Tax=Bowmanella dokdonensis TaxID=751969 RepID=A0A939INR1_9ALTE|nr:transglutaminase domain-containing protein [Bowmanella dokdonensis]MBN7825105.1 hypothetical protein [Bowmanella dokdonensis]